MALEPAPWAPAANAPWIASIGHSDHPWDTFLALLATEDVRRIVDVRRLPRGFVSHYDKERLAPALRAAGLEYLHLPDLGGKRDIPYPDHMGTPAWQRAYDRLRAVALAARHDGGVAAFLCVERDPAGCHRRHIAQRLEQDGWRVRHILPDPAQARLF